jgi:hypothetical protein
MLPIDTLCLIRLVALGSIISRGISQLDRCTLAAHRNYPQIKETGAKYTRGYLDAVSRAHVYTNIAHKILTPQPAFLLFKVKGKLVFSLQFH